jgi:hydroxypyruvate reductase
MSRQAEKQILQRLYRAALRGADPAEAVARALRSAEVAEALRGARRVGIFAAGKAAAGMFDAAFRPGRPSLVILPRGFARPRRRPDTLLFAAHPEPDRSSLAAARAAIRFFARFGAGDALLCLISGGTSSLLCLPRRGLTLGIKRRRIRTLARTGAPIEELNRLRSELSQIKGGRLGHRTPARLINLVLSDVPGDRPTLVGSGPTIRGRRRDLTRVVASNRAALEAARREARRGGLRVRLWHRRLGGEAREAGGRFARAARSGRPGVLLAGGETTVSLSSGAGRGGRSLELALGAALVLEATKGVAILAAGSDGRDGSSDAAGAFADGSTAPRARRRGLDPLSALARHESHLFFERLGDLFRPGATGTNVCDFAIAVVRNRETPPARVAGEMIHPKGGRRSRARHRM